MHLLLSKSESCSVLTQNVVAACLKTTSSRQSPSGHHRGVHRPPLPSTGVQRGPTSKSVTARSNGWEKGRGSPHPSISKGEKRAGTAPLTRPSCYLGPVVWGVAGAPGKGVPEGSHSPKYEPFLEDSMWTGCVTLAHSQEPSISTKVLLHLAPPAEQGLELCCVRTVTPDLTQNRKSGKILPMASNFRGGICNKVASDYIKAPGLCLF